MKLYVWEGVLADWTSGMAVIVASSDDKAAAKLKELFPRISEGLILDGVKPEIVDCRKNGDAQAWWVHGGG